MGFVAFTCMVEHRLVMLLRKSHPYVSSSGPHRRQLQQHWHKFWQQLGLPT